MSGTIQKARPKPPKRRSGFTADEQRLLTLAKTSPALALAHDKPSWLKLFAPDGQSSVNDPVGSPIHDTLAKISKFYDTFIAPNEIIFKEFVDYVDLPRRKVYRVVDIHITFPNGGIQVQPVHLKYIFNLDGQVMELRAYWNFLNGFPGDLSPTGLVRYCIGASKAFYTIFRNYGVMYGSAYLKSLGAGSISYGRSLVKDFFAALNEILRLAKSRNDEKKDGEISTKVKQSCKKIETLIESKNVEIELPENVTVVASKVFDAKDLMNMSSNVFEDQDVKMFKIINGKMYNSSYCTSVQFEVEKMTGVTVTGLGIFELNNNGTKIARIELIWS